MSIRLRNSSETDILYFLISKRYPTNNPLFQIPEEFRNNDVLQFLNECPKNLVQLGHSLPYFEASIAYDLIHSINLKIIYENDINHIEKLTKNSNNVIVFCIDMNIKKTKSLLKKIRFAKGKKFFFLYNSLQNNLPNISSNDIVTTSLDLVKKIIANKKFILNKIPSLNRLSFSFDEIEDKNLKRYSFKPTRTNFFTLNQILNHYWDKGSQKYFVSKETASNDALQASEARDSFQRQEIILKQVKQLDTLVQMCYSREIVFPVTGLEPILPPLILIFPYHFPQTKKILSQKETYSFGENNITAKKIFRSLQPEQSSNYVSPFHPSQFKSELEANFYFEGQKSTSEKLGFIDSVSSLHSSFFYSPILRFPIVGRSINKEVSFFGSKIFKKLSQTKVKNKIKQTILDLGKKMTTDKISPEVLKHIKSRNGQIVAISDLPIEWLNIEGIPLCFTHDVCRIPEHPTGGILSHFASNNHMEMTIDRNTYKKTLVIYGCDDNRFKKWRNIVEELKKELDFNTAMCKSVSEVKQSIKKHKPEILIFDCHGDHDEKTSSTHLCIFDEYLTNQKIIDNKITAPIVFLSACNTAPNYGFFNSIAQGFFEAGAISVTTTFLPVDINLSSLLYVRLLVKLKAAIENNIHKNWLDFTSHIVRSSSVLEAVNYAIRKNGTSSDEYKNNVSDPTTEIITDLLEFNKRRKVYTEIDKKITTINQEYQGAFEKQIPEYLFYSHLGRPDLIYFEGWLNKKRDKNSFPLDAIKKQNNT